MRWFERPAKRGPRSGEYRTRKGFLILPKKIRGEWRWLESASWTEQYCLDWVGSFSGTHYYAWVPVAWVERVNEYGN